MGFITSPLLLPSTFSHPRTLLRCCAASPNPPPRLSRRRLLSGAAAATAALLAASLPPPALANNGTGLERAFSKVLFPKEGFNAPDSLQPSGATIDKKILGTKDAQNALKKLREYENNFMGLYDQFKKDPQIELTSSVKNMVNISDLRNALNVVNEAVDEQSQTQTDKIVRGIIQDIGELEVAAGIKKGGQRTSKKVDRTSDWLAKITGDFTRLLSFYS